MASVGANRGRGGSGGAGENTAFTSLAFEAYPWSHSLVMAILWSVVAGLIARAILRDGRAAWILGAVVFSHWVLDFFTHRPDLPLWAGGPRVGLGLWNSIAGTILVEGAFFAGAVALYAYRAKPAGPLGRWALWGLVALTGGIWISQPWSPPPPSATAVALVALAIWILPLWAGWVERHRLARSAEP